MMTRCDLHEVDVDRRGCPWCQLEEAQETAGRYYEDCRKMKWERDEVVSVCEKQGIAAEKSIEEYKACVDKWRLWYDNASEDAKKWRRDAQKFYGALQRIIAVAENDVISCEPTVFDIAREALADRP